MPILADACDLNVSVPHSQVVTLLHVVLIIRTFLVGSSSFANYSFDSLMCTIKYIVVLQGIAYKTAIKNGKLYTFIFS
jgi:hypothetical protein